MIGKIKVLEHITKAYKGKLIDQAYKTANMKCTLNLKTNSKTETSTFNRSGERAKNFTELKSEAILSLFTEMLQFPQPDMRYSMCAYLSDSKH